ncbi:MAG: hypothetical protein II518_02675 [Candidatus Methanomethylophilus sp.]|nr:hypothetical protein [Methanomethylophilus sp.]
MAKKETKNSKPRKKKKEEGYYHLTPKGCLCCSLDKVMPGLVTDDQKDLVWMVFEDLMKRQGYVKEDKE